MSAARTSVKTAIVAAVVLLVTSAGVAEEKLLRWKFHKGQELDVEVTQTSQTETTVGNTTLKMDLAWVMEMKWIVGDVDQDGSASMTQSFSRMRIEMTAPQVGKIEFDSSADEEPEGYAEVIANRIGPLIGADFTVKMNHRGGIEDVQFPEEVIQQLEETAPSSNLKGLLSRDGIDKILRQSLAVLPEQAVDQGDSWDLTNDTPSPIGTLRQSHKYTYESTETRDGQPVETIAVDSKVEIVPAKGEPASKTTLKKQEQTGQMYFDAQAGRVVESSLVQRLQSETPFRDLKIRVRVDSTMRTRITPAAP